MLFLNDHLAHGGAEHSMAKIVRGLAVNPRFHVNIALLEDRQTFDVPDSVAMWRFRKRFVLGPVGKFLTLPLDALRLTRLVRRYGAASVCSFQHRANFVNVLAKRLFRSKHQCIISERVHVAEYYRHKHLLGLSSGPVRDLLATLASAMVRRLYRHADAVTCNAQDTRQCLVTDYGVPPELVHVIPNGYDVETILDLAAKPVQADDRHLFESDRQVLVNVGRLCRQKGQDHLLRAFARLDRPEDYRLLLLGNGPWREKLEGMARDLGIAESVHFLGYRPNPYPYMANADCFAFPSRYEGYPNAMAEAMVCNTPVVAFEFRAGAQELLEDGRYGALVPLGDVEGLADALAHHRSPSRRPLASEQDTVDRYARLFEDLL